ncbi:MAG: SDR family oxidoreductase [Mucilaginibacter sp.]
MTISILGCGWYGRALASNLLKKGLTVKGSATSHVKIQELKQLGISPYLVCFTENDRSYDPDFFKCDVAVIAIPPGFKKGAGSIYLNKIQGIIEAMVAQGTTKAVYISSTGVYGNRNKEVDETDEPEPDSESGEILLEAEKLFRSEARLKTAIIRFGGLVGPGRNPAHFFSGKSNIPNGLAPVNLIHQSDCVGITEAIIRKDSFGLTVNACTPDHPSKADFYCEMSVRAKLPIPQFINELKDWKIVNSVNLSNKINYQFIIGSWKHYIPDN